MKKNGYYLLIFLSLPSLVFAGETLQSLVEEARTRTVPEKITKTPEEWKKILTPEQFHVCREKGTERAFTGDYWNHKKKGEYVCTCCELPLFSSDAKFDSGTGWPSFWQPVKKENIHYEEDHSYGMKRVEVLCSRCDSHLGHVFEDGPKPTGLRYCINSVSLKFIEKEGK